MIDFQNVSKLLGGRDILLNASFRVNKGERVGFVGPNGSGKTTVFSMIAGDMSVDKGDIIKPEKARIGFLRQQLGLFRESETLLSYVKAASGELPEIGKRIHEIEHQLATDSSNENLLDELGHLQSTFEHLGGYEMEHRAAAALAGLGFREEDFTKAMGDFSGGWQMRASMARVLLGEPDILMLDEPSNYLDIPAVEWLRRRLKNYEGTLLLISHDRFLLNSLTNVTAEINGGKITRYPGNYQFYVTERENRRVQAEASKKNLDKQKKTLEDNINRFRYKASKAAQVQSWIKMLDKMEDVELPEDLHFTGRIRIPAPPHSGQELVRLEHVTHSYDGTKTILEDITLNVSKGDKIGVVGYNGTGKSTLLKVIAGRFEPSSGTRTLGHKAVVGYQAQEFAELLPPEQSAFDVVREASFGAGDVSGQRVREILGAFGFSGESALKQCKVLSGGEKIRLCFARIFVNPPNLLILDEPTTHLDIAAREALQEALRSYEGTVCLVSHDVEFLRGSADIILEMQPRKTRFFPGNYDYYKEKTALEESESTQKRKSLDNISSDNNQKERRREKAARRNEMLPEKKRLEKDVARLEKLIEKSESEKEALLASLVEQTSETPPDYAAVQKRIKALDYDISIATCDWEKAAQNLEDFMKIYNGYL